MDENEKLAKKIAKKLKQIEHLESIKKDGSRELNEQELAKL